MFSLLACAVGTSDANRLADALAIVRDRPAEAAAACAAIRDPSFSADCLTTGALALALTDPAAAEALCTAIPSSQDLDECHFRLAEVSRDIHRCAGVGAFIVQCREHLLPLYVAAFLPASGRPGEVEDLVAATMREAGLQDVVPRAWIAVYDRLLADDVPLDIGACRSAPSGAQQQACRAAALHVFDERINQSRREGRFPCDGGALPLELAVVPDPRFTAALDARRSGDLCEEEGAWSFSPVHDAWKTTPRRE